MRYPARRDTVEKSAPIPADPSPVRLLLQWLTAFQGSIDQNEDGVVTLAEMVDMFHGASARQLEQDPTAVLSKTVSGESPASVIHSEDRPVLVPQPPPPPSNAAPQLADEARSKFAGKRKSTRDVVKEKVRNKFFDDYHEVLWGALKTEVFDADDSGTPHPLHVVALLVLLACGAYLVRLSFRALQSASGWKISSRTSRTTRSSAP